MEAIEQLYKIKAKSNGLHGVALSYMEIGKSMSGMNSINDHACKYRTPAHSAFVDAWQSLRVHVLSAFRMKDVELEDVELDCVTIDPDGYVLEARVAMPEDGTAMGKVTTGVLSEETYSLSFGDLKMAVSILEREAKVYMAGLSKVDSKKIVMQLFQESVTKGKKSDLTQEMIDEMDEEQADAYFKSKLEKKGYIVFDSGDVGEQDDEGIKFLDTE
jgi:hypothetical protein